MLPKQTGRVCDSLKWPSISCNCLSPVSRFSGSPVIAYAQLHILKSDVDGTEGVTYLASFLARADKAFCESVALGPSAVIVSRTVSGQ